MNSHPSDRLAERRELFEANINKNEWLTTYDLTWDESINSYDRPNTHDAWAGFNASLAKQQATPEASGAYTRELEECFRMYAKLNQEGDTPNAFIERLRQRFPQVPAAQSGGATPSSNWHSTGEPDPHQGRYDCERAALAMGNLTDEELANGAFLNYDVRPSMQDIIDRKASSPIMWMTAVKDRIRWLSRSLEKALATPSPQEPTVARAVAWVTLCQGKVVNTYYALADAEFHAARMQWGSVGVVLPHPATPSQVIDKVDTAKSLRSIKSNLMHQRRFGTDSINGWRGACTSAEADIEELLAALAATGEGQKT